MKSCAYHYNNYLSKCDLMNKYNTFDSLKTPKINSIILDIPLKQLTSLIPNSSTSKNFIKKLEKKMFFILFLQTGLKPFINVNLDKNKKVNSSLQLRFETEDDINSFIFNFFMHLNSNTFFKHFIYLNAKNKTNIDSISKKGTFNLKLPIFFLPELNMLVDHFFNNVNLKEFNTYLYFNFENVSNPSNVHNFIKNLPCFWEIKKNNILK